LPSRSRRWKWLARVDDRELGHFGIGIDVVATGERPHFHKLEEIAVPLPLAGGAAVADTAGLGKGADALGRAVVAGVPEVRRTGPPDAGLVVSEELRVEIIAAGA
jgi:hypothetical protein